MPTASSAKRGFIRTEPDNIVIRTAGEMVKGSGAASIVGSVQQSITGLQDVAIEKAYQDLYALGIHPINAVSLLHLTFHLHFAQNHDEGTFMNIRDVCQIGERGTGNCFKVLNNYQMSAKL